MKRYIALKSISSQKRISLDLQHYALQSGASLPGQKTRNLLHSAAPCENKVEKQCLKVLKDTTCNFLASHPCSTFAFDAWTQNWTAPETETIIIIIDLGITLVIPVFMLEIWITLNSMRTPFFTASSWSSLVAVTPIGFRPGEFDKNIADKYLKHTQLKDLSKFMSSHPLRPWNISAPGLIDIWFLSRPANKKLTGGSLWWVKPELQQFALPFSQRGLALGRSRFQGSSWPSHRVNKIHNY